MLRRYQLVHEKISWSYEWMYPLRFNASKYVEKHRFHTCPYTCPPANLKGVNRGKGEESENERNATRSQTESRPEGIRSKLKEL